MTALARDDPQPRCAAQPGLLHVPAGAAQHFVARSSQASDVGQLRAGHEADRNLLRQAEQLGQPSAGYLLDDARGRSEDVQAGVLVPH